MGIKIEALWKNIGAKYLQQLSKSVSLWSQTVWIINTWLILYYQSCIYQLKYKTNKKINAKGMNSMQIYYNFLK